MPPQKLEEVKIYEGEKIKILLFYNFLFSISEDQLFYSGFVQKN